MFTITHEIDVARTAEDAFDFMADMRNETNWNFHMKSVVLTSPEPIGLGTTFDTVRKGSGPSRMEITTYDRPNRLVFVGTFRGGAYTYDARFTSSGNGVHVAGSIEMRLSGLMRLLTPMIRSRLAKEMPAEDAEFKRAVEGTPTA